MRPRSRVVSGVFVTGIVVVLGLGVGLLADANHAPSADRVVFAKGVSDLLLNETVAALFQEFGETTAANADQGKAAISLIFNNGNRDLRLIGAFAPLLGGDNNMPVDDFEKTALGLALQGQATDALDRVQGRWYYRRSIALSNTFHTACVICHANFTPELFANNPGQWVGALVLRVPIEP